MIESHPDLELTRDNAQRLLEAWLGRPVVCRTITRLEGGMINTVLRLEFDRPPHRAVVKLHEGDGAGHIAEARALDYLATETACPVPKVYLQDSSARLIPHVFLLLEHVPGVRLNAVDLRPEERDHVDAQLANVLAELHSHHGDGWGPIGTDERSSRWEDVFVPRLIEARSRPEVERRLSPRALAHIDLAIDLAREALSDSVTPTLVHGDVWDGNLMVHFDNGRWRLTALLDPEAQFADVEYELAYLEVFGSNRDVFFRAYADHHTTRPGYEYRRQFYWLYTGLVHVALFGSEPYCRFTTQTAERIAQDRFE